MRPACSTGRWPSRCRSPSSLSALVGLAIERGVIRFLYGRPLETLLATWGVSLILQQAVRTIFGPTNREVGNPSWMSGSFDLGQLSITWNRLWILVFALGVFALLLFVMKRTRWGLQMRAVTANRRMAVLDGHPHAVGRRADLRARLRHCRHRRAWRSARSTTSRPISARATSSTASWSWSSAASAISGARWSARLSLGILNKFLEPYAGAVLGKIVVLVLIILFIQKRPRGLFALKGRAVEA